jgi:hypothetical protein
MNAITEVKSKQRLSEDERILSVQLELFPLANEDDVKQTLHILKQYVELRMQVEDYKNHEEEIRLTIYEGEVARRIDADELYSNKTANAVIVAINQKRAAEECDVIKKAIERAVGLITDSDARIAVSCRYLQGMTYKETLSNMHKGEKSSTMDRKIKFGLASTANTLKLWGII